MLLNTPVGVLLNTPTQSQANKIVVLILTWGVAQHPNSESGQQNQQQQQQQQVIALVQRLFHAV